MEIKNAKITSTMLGIEDHGIVTFMIFVEFDGSVCGVGAYSIGIYDKNRKEGRFTKRGLEAIPKILDIVGVDSWEDLPGNYIRTKVRNDNCGAKIDEIGNLMEDRWFNLQEHFCMGNMKVNGRLNALHEELDYFLNHAPIEGDCSNEENQMYSNMANLKQSIENLEGE